MTHRIISAVPIPFTQHGDLDLGAFEKALSGVEPHVGSVLVAGTTGEFPSLQDEERIAAFSLAVDVLGADRVIAHLGHASSRQVLVLAEQTRALGIHRLALISPYYLPSDDAGVVSFYASLTDRHGDASIYPYLFPERTGMDVSPEVLASVMALPGMRGVKLSGGAAARYDDYAAVLIQGQEVYSGDDSTLPWVAKRGGTGVVSGVSAAFPATFGALAGAIDHGDQTAAATLQADVRSIVALVGPTITRLKAALAARCGSDWASRMPLPAVPADVRTQIVDVVARHF